MSTIVFTMRFEGAAGAVQEVQKVDVELQNVEKRLAAIAVASQALIKAELRFKGLEKKIKEAAAEAKILEEKLSIKPDIKPEVITKLDKELQAVQRTAALLNKEFDDVGQEIRELNKELRAGAGRSDDGYKQLQARLGQLNALVKESRTEVRKQQRAFEEASAASGSYRQLNLTLGRLRTQFRDLGAEARDGIAGQQLLTRIDKLDRELKDIDNTLGINVRNVGNYRQAISKLQRAINAFTSFEILGTGIRDLVRLNSEFSDGIADVQKTTKLSREEVRGLSDDLGELDTRTSQIDLLNISQIGGQLGVARDELEGFTESVDKAVVSLGDELGGGVDEISERLGKLAQNLDTGVTGDIGAQINAIGSGINELGSSSSANAGRITDFATRLQGVAGPAKITAGELLGLGSILDQFGIAPEASSTAVQKLITSLGEDIPRFAKIAGVSVNELRNTLQTKGANEGLIQVLEGLNAQGKGVEEISSILVRLGVDSARAGVVVSTLANNTQKLRDEQTLATAAIKEGTSLTAEFATKNQTLAANVEKLEKVLISLVVDTGFQDFLSDTILGITSIIMVLVNLPKAIEENKEEFILLGIAIGALSWKAAAAGALSLVKSLRTAAIAQKALTFATKAFDLIVRLNPIGLLITALTAVAFIILQVSKDVDGARKTWAGWLDKIRDFVKLVPGLNILFTVLVEPILALITAALNMQATWDGLKAGAAALKNSLGSNFKKIGIEAEILFLKLKRAFTFDDSNLDKLNNEIKNLEIDSSNLSEQGESAADAFQSAFENTRGRLADEAAEQRRAELAANAAEDAAAVAKGAAGSTSGPAGSTTPPGGSGDLFIPPPSEESIQQAIEDRKAAIDKIRRLEIQLLEDGQKEVQQAIDENRASLKSLVGDPEQLVEQASLLRQTLRKELSEIFATQRTAILEGAQGQVEEIGQSTNGLLPSPIDIQRQADAIRNEVVTSYTTIFTTQEQVLREQSQGAIDALTGTPDQVAYNTLLLKQELLLSLDDLRKQKEEFNAELIASDTERAAAVLEIQLTSLDQIAEAEAVKRAENLAKKLEQIRLDAEAENLTREEIKIAEDEAIAEAEELELDKEVQDLEDKLELLRNKGANELDILKQIADARIGIATNRTDKEIEQEQRLAKAEKKLNAIKKKTLGDGLDFLKDVLGSSEEARKKNAGALKILSVAEVGINLQGELSNIFKEYSKLGIPGQILAIIQAGISVGRATSSIARINAASFRDGGNINGFAKPGESYVIGQGYVPNNGVIQGANHSSGGVKYVTADGEIVELEGGEFNLQNGNSSHIINKNSANLFGPELRQLSRFPDGPEKAAIASRINSYNSYGRSFHYGGTLPGSLLPKFVTGGDLSGSSVSQVALSPVAAGTTPTLLGVSGASQGNGELLESIQEQNNLLLQSQELLQAGIEATNSRIDRIEIFTNPEDLVRAGLAAIDESDNNSGL